MDGFGTNANVVVIASTNMKDSLDPAILWAGWFDRVVEVDLPTLEEREEIFETYLKKLKITKIHTLEYFKKWLATLTPGFSGAEIKNACNEAAIGCVWWNGDEIVDNDFETAIERVIGGLEWKPKEFEESRKIVAVHECGHAVVSWFLPGGSPLIKLTIKPRSKGSLGFA